MNESILSKRLALFPITTQLQDQGAHTVLEIAGCNLTDLAGIFNTPLYLVDRQTLDDSVSQYRQALARFYPGKSGLTYAGKAFLCLAIAQWAERIGLWIDCTGAGEISIARQAGVSPQNVLVHGVNKSDSDLSAALINAGKIVVDNLDELSRLINLLRSSEHQCPEIWLRLRPGLAVDTHAYTQTGQVESKFGISPQQWIQAVRTCLEAGLPLRGLHFHQGSHFHIPAPLAPAIETALDLITTLHQQTGWLPEVICPGGGWGVPYHEDDLPHPPIESYVRFIAEQVVEGCLKRSFPLPRLQLEPGRSLVARAGVAVYRVGSVKSAGERRWLLLDGGLADNPRPALYGARYTALPVTNPDRPLTEPTWLAGPYCESGDVLIEDLLMPEIEPRELIAIPVSGAYQLSMGSNYNGALKPAVLWLDEGKPQLIQSRETYADLIRRDHQLIFTE